MLLSVESDSDPKCGAHDVDLEAGVSTEGGVDATCVQFGSRGKIPPPSNMFVVCNCESYKHMDYLILCNYDVASALVSIPTSS